MFGILGGFIASGLDYDKLSAKFDYRGGEVGGYATYLNGGLFVDTLLKADFVEFDPNGTVGFPGSLNSTAWGVRTDAGYRFGSFQRGFFFEPLATIAFNWVDIDDFAAGGTKVTQRRETPKGISSLSLRLTKVALGGVPKFTGELQEGMHETLTKIKAAAER